MEGENATVRLICIPHCSFRAREVSAVDTRLDAGIEDRDRDLPSRCLTPVRSITEIYRSAEMKVQKTMADYDGVSATSDEGMFLACG